MVRRIVASLDRALFPHAARTDAAWRQTLADLEDTASRRVTRPMSSLELTLQELERGRRSGTDRRG